MDYKYPVGMTVYAATMYMMGQHKKVESRLAVMKKDEGYVVSGNHIPVDEEMGEIKTFYMTFQGGLTPDKKDSVYYIDAFKYEDYDGETSYVKLYEADMTIVQLETLFNEL